MKEGFVGEADGVGGTNGMSEDVLWKWDRQTAEFGRKCAEGLVKAGSEKTASPLSVIPYFKILRDRANKIAGGEFGIKGEF